ncbi:MAG TPA: hypothetical protein VNN08_24800, partial [Thermoanaerobaculia bacterium]|nr:hypothetical protein [Thermoanaerobaculia bacterium]
VGGRESGVGVGGRESGCPGVVRLLGSWWPLTMDILARDDPLRPGATLEAAERRNLRSPQRELWEKGPAQNSRGAATVRISPSRFAVVA